MNNNMDKEEFINAVSYFKSITKNNTSKNSPHKMGATIIGIKTNITGNLKLHIYVLLFPFIKNETSNYVYDDININIYFKDVCFYVDEKFYLWLYEEMKRQNSIVLLSLDSYVLKVIPGGYDTLISIDKNCTEKKEWMDLDYEAWYEKNIFNNVFTIRIVNPFLYMVPFPVQPIIIKTIRKRNSYVEIVKYIE
jgi:hypothetical protein